MGGSDQWGNILNGVELIRKINKKKSFGITSPLLTNSDGSKMGKTADGAVWLSEKKLSNFDFFQYWRNVEDEDVGKFLNLFTKLPLNEIKKLSSLKNKEINEAKQILAYEVTKLVRGEKQALEAQDITNNLFKTKISDSRANNISIQSIEIKNHTFSIIDAIEKLNLVNSRSEIKRLIKSNGVKINDTVYLQNDFSLSKFYDSDYLKITIGKKKIGIVNIIKNKL